MPLRLVISISAVLLGSGLCALVYQTVWLRQFRLIFGASTPATATVLALFMAGLGFGGLYFGRRAEGWRRPLHVYALLEAGIAISAALSPLLLEGVRWAYLAIGGTVALGDWGAIPVRLLGATLVMGVPVFLMGGTLPVVARAITSTADVGRRKLALLYGLNTLGAVSGALVTTFYLFERLGERRTLWLACGLNVLLAVLGRVLSRLYEPQAHVEAPHQDMPVDTNESVAASVSEEKVPSSLILIAAFATGFTFFLVELVWYRMGAPILGGSTYTFGLILAVALFGIGAGGLLYALIPPARATPGAFALTCALQAVVLLVPFALGDRLALFAFHLHELGRSSFSALAIGWTLLALVIVLPASLVSGYQFPLLLALKGRADEGVARDVGDVYASNTLGAIAGSLAGGFGLIPLIGAEAAWCLSALLVAAAGMLLGVASPGRQPRLLLGAASLCAVAAVLSLAEGPTSVWRHHPIGAGRGDLAASSANELEAKLSHYRDLILEHHEGVESALGFWHQHGLAFVVNGKTDGNAVLDAPTQVGLSMVPAVLHGDVKKAFVIGLGTGQTAGFAGVLPGIERVDVAEIERDVLRFAELCSLSNHGVLDNPKVNVIVGDGREALLTSDEHYDLIVSEPSNPYRAGIASFYTKEFYAAVRGRLAPGGLFVQWLQAYEVDAEIIPLTLATLYSAFDSVSVWRTQLGDLLLIGSQEPFVIDAEALRARLKDEPYREAMADVLGTPDLEGFLGLHLMSPKLSRALADGVSIINTDDWQLLEYSFARSVGRGGARVSVAMADLARKRDADRPEVLGDVDWDRVDEGRHRIAYRLGIQISAGAPYAEGEVHAFWRAWIDGNYRRAAELVPILPLVRPEDDPFFAVARIDTLVRAPRDDAREGEESESDTPEEPLDVALLSLEKIGRTTEAAFLTLTHALREKRPAEEVVALAEKALHLARSQPWFHTLVVRRTLDNLRNIEDPELGHTMSLLLLEEPFALHALDHHRITTAQILMTKGMPEHVSAHCARALIDNPVPWTRSALRDRALCAETHAPEALSEAMAALERFLSREATSLESYLSEP